MGAITDSNVETRAGSGSISIDPDNDIAGLPNTTVKISDLGTLEIEYDLEEQDDDARNILFSPSKFKFKAFDKLGNGGSLFEELDSVASTTDIEIEFSFTTDGGQSWSDTLIFNTNDIEYDRARREVSFEAVFFDDADAYSITDVFDIAPVHTTDTFNNGVATRRCQLAHNFIENVFDLSTTDSVTAVIESDSFLDETNVIDGSEQWVVVENRTVSGSIYEQEENAGNALYRLAAAEGSIVGRMMGYIYFVNRVDEGNDVSVSEGDTESLDIMPSLSNYNSVILLLTAGVGTEIEEWCSIDAMYTTSDGLNPKATKSLFGNYFMLELQPATYDETNDEYDDDGFNVTTNTGTDITTEPKDGDTVFELDSDPSLVDGDFITVNGDYTGLNIVKSSDASRMVTYDGWRGYRNTGSGTPLSVNKYDNITTRPLLAGRAVTGYAKAYGADGSRRIELTFLDIDTLKPYETFTLDSSFPSAVQNQTFRPSRLTYNLKTDRIKVEAYQIS